MPETTQAISSESSVPVNQPTNWEDPALAGGAPSIPPKISAVECLAEDIPINESNLGLVMDVELNALLRFGQRLLTLREVLDLKCGSVVELDRRVDEPVELLLDGRVIARGEAAIVDGNYCLRVTEIVRPGGPIRMAKEDGER
jgi:flagellar motor switch protein FliN